MKQLIGKNAVRLYFLDRIKIHPVVNVSHTIPHVEQPDNISAPITPVPAPVYSIQRDESEVKANLNHGKKDEDISSYP